MKIAIDIGSAGAGNRRDWPECVRFALEGEGAAREGALAG